LGLVVISQTVVSNAKPSNEGIWALKSPNQRFTKKVALRALFGEGAWRF
jgi:hypothetical protein